MAKVSSARVFWRTAIPFGVAMAVFRLGHFPLPYVIGVGVVFGALFGVTAVWLQRRGERRLEAQGIETDNLEPLQERSLEVARDSAVVYEAARRALLKLRKLRLVKESAITGELDAKTGATRSSWGECITVRVTGDGPNSTVHIATRPRLSTTVMDSGKGVENVALFSRYLLSDLDAAAPNQRLERP